MVELMFIVRHVIHTFATREHLRLILAAVFAVVLFAEWGSHGVILSHHSNVGGVAASNSERGHDDPCKTLICNDSQRRDQGFRFSHESSQHNAFFDALAPSNERLDAGSSRLLLHEIVSGISRPPDPEFHPPEIS